MPAGFTSIDPVYEYPHASVAGADPLYAGSSVVGGHVYRGDRISGLSGAYVFCDSVSGNVWKRDHVSGAVTRIVGVGGAYGVLVSMGVDPANKDLLFADYIGGRLLRLVSTTVGGSFPATLGATGLFADLTDLLPNPGLIPYEPNLSFWSDHAIKRRWFSIPGADRMTWARDANWVFPTGSVWVKHFDLELMRGNPATRRRVETRVLVKTDANVYGVSYRWNDAQTEAVLVPDDGAGFDLTVAENGTPRVQRWDIPSRSSCLTCHTPQAGGALSFSTRQLNRFHTINGFVGNQLTLLHEAGYFHNDPGSPHVLPRHLRAEETAYPLEARVRSYLAVNCAYCHRADGTVSGSRWEGRPEFGLAQTGLVNGVPLNNHGNAANRYVVPGDSAHSVVYNRVAVANGFTRMPPLATNELDATSIALLEAWITQSLPLRQDYAGWRQQRFGSVVSPEGAPEADADDDLVTNEAEFIAGTDPLDGGSFLATAFSSDGTNATVSFALPADRSAYVETSTDLVTWTRWNAPGNDAIQRTAGILVITGPISSPRQFFRLRITES